MESRARRIATRVMLAGAPVRVEGECQNFQAEERQCINTPAKEKKVSLFAFPSTVSVSFETR